MITGFRKKVNQVYYYFNDMKETFMGRDPLVPPESMIFVGDGDFRAIGDEFKGYFITHGNLSRNDRILDVGCGIGRMAVPLTKFLSARGEYHGFDASSMGIAWCCDTISKRFHNFHFKHFDFYNGTYNPSGSLKPSQFRFPFQDSFFDFIFLTSVFTHMIPEDMERYLSEIGRVLKAGHRCLITFFLLNGTSQHCLDQGLSSLDFNTPFRGCLTLNGQNPEAAIAYSEMVVRQDFEDHGLRIVEPVHYGSWCGRNEFISYQDMIIAEKIS